MLPPYLICSALEAGPAIALLFPLAEWLGILPYPCYRA